MALASPFGASLERVAQAAAKPKSPEGRQRPWLRLTCCLGRKAVHCCSPRWPLGLLNNTAGRAYPVGRYRLGFIASACATRSKLACGSLQTSGTTPPQKTRIGQAGKGCQPEYRPVSLPCPFQQIAFCDALSFFFGGGLRHHRPCQWHKKLSCRGRFNRDHRDR